MFNLPATEAQTVVAVDVTTQGSDSGLMKPMYDQVCEQYEVIPQEYLVDGGFSKKEDITELEQNGTKVYAPLYNEKKQLESGQDPYASRKGESPELTTHRARMGTDEAKAIYKRRSAIAEFPNADCRNRGLSQFRVRGLLKAKAQTLWHVLAFNLQRMQKLRCELRGQSYLVIVMSTCVVYATISVRIYVWRLFACRRFATAEIRRFAIQNIVIRSTMLGGRVAADWAATFPANAFGSRRVPEAHDRRFASRSSRPE